MNGIVIVGAGEAGVSAAFSLRENGYDGPIDLLGAELHIPYERPPLSKFPPGEEIQLHRSIRSMDSFSERQITLHTGELANGVDPVAHMLKLVDGRTLTYSKLLIATGAVPRRLAIPGGQNCIYLRNLEDAHVLRSMILKHMRIAVIGAGFIGLEVAAAARQMGCDVSVFEGSPRILSRSVPEEIAALLHARHLAAGVRIFCNQDLVEITQYGQFKRLHFSDGSICDTDVVLAGIGSLPVTTLAEQAGLQVNNGISVDDQLRTLDTDIFAAGDCCSFPMAVYGGQRVRLENWRAAQVQGNVAARNMIGHAQCFDSIPWFWSDQYELTLEIAGLPGFATRTVRRDGVQGDFRFHLDDTNRIVAVSALGNGNRLSRDVRLSEMLIAARTIADPAVLQSQELKLKNLLPK